MFCTVDINGVISTDNFQYCKFLHFLFQMRYRISKFPYIIHSHKKKKKEKGLSTSIDNPFVIWNI